MALFSVDDDMSYLLPVVCNELHGMIQWIPLCWSQFLPGGTIEFFGLILVLAVSFFAYSYKVHRIVALLIGVILSASLYVAYPSPIFAAMTIIGFVAIFGFIGLQLKNATTYEQGG